MKWIDTLLKDDWKTKIGKTINFYNRAMFYQNFAKGQIMMPLGLMNETLWILTYLAVLGIKPSATTTLLTYVFALFILMAIGKLLIFLDWMKYIQRLGNAENLELMEIKADLKEIKKRLGI